MQSHEVFRSTDWAPIGEAAGQVIEARHVRYGKDEGGFVTYFSEEGPGVSYRPAYDPQWDYPASIEIRQGWAVMPRYLADGRPWVFPSGGAKTSANRPPMPDFRDPGSVAQLDAVVARYLATIPPPTARIDLYRACEGDNPGFLVRGE